VVSARCLVAAVRDPVLSARIGGVLPIEVLERGDQLVEVRRDLAVVGGQSTVAVVLGQVDQLEGLVALTPVNRQERRGGLEVR